MNLTAVFYDKKNKPDAMSGKHDDLLISDMIANEIRSQQMSEIGIASLDRNKLS